MIEGDSYIKSKLEHKPDIFIRASDDDSIKEVKHHEPKGKIEFHGHDYETEIKDIECVLLMNTIKREDESITYPAMFSDSEAIKEESATDDKTAIEHNICLDPIDVKNESDSALINFESTDDLGNCSKNTSRCKGGNSTQINMQDSDEKLQCDTCSEQFKIKYNLRSGAKPYSCRQYVHMDSEKVLCDVCLKWFKSDTTLKTHQFLHTSRKLYNCEKCSYETRVKKYLIRHQQTHNDVMEYQCDICLIRFKTKQYLKYHRVVHSAETWYNCHRCSYKTRRQDYLRNHCSAVHGEVRKWQCDICSMQFKSERYLRKHNLIHGGEKPYGCEKCSYKANSRYRLNRHHLIHDEIKKYQCDNRSVPHHHTCAKYPFQANTESLLRSLLTAPSVSKQNLKDCLPVHII